MMRNITVKFAVAGCILVICGGCGISEPGTAEISDTTAPSEIGPEDEAITDTGCITVAQAKAAVLENAGLAEEDVRFVHISLDTENGVSEYDMEFICQDAEYDYRISAVTGEILSMACEAGKYDLETLPSESAQSTVTSQDIAQSAADLKDTAQSADVPETDGQYIGNEKAKQIALEHAGLAEDEVWFAHAQLELDDRNWKYDIEFLKDNTEYDYDIDALTGEILSFDQDAEHDRPGTRSSAGNEQFTEEQAKQIALEYAGVDERDVQHLKIELDYDHGSGKYEVEWDVGRTEYSCDVDADTGSILSFEKELD